MSSPRKSVPSRPLRLSVEGLEQRTVPAYLTNPGTSIAVGNVIAGVAGNEIVEGTGAGGGPLVSVYNLAGQKMASFFAFDPSFRGGVNVAVADVNGDGVDDIIASPGPGGGPQVRAFSYTGNQLLSFFAYDPSFRGGVQLAGGLLDSSGKAEIVTGPGPGGGPIVREFDHNGKLKASIVAFDPLFRGGVNVAVGDVDGSGQNEIVTGAGVGGAPLVQVYNTQGRRLGEFYAFDSGERNGVSVAAGNTDGIGADEIWTTRGPGSDSTVRGYQLDGTLLSSFVAYDPSYTGGVNFAVGDGNGDGIADVLTVQATGDYQQQPTIFAGQRGLVPQGPTYTLTTGYYAADNNFTYYFPSGYSSTQKYPIMFAFDPGGNTTNGINGVYDTQLRQAADRYGFILVTSKYFHSIQGGPLADGATLDMTYNSAGQVFPSAGFTNLLSQIHSVLDTITNADKSRVILYGYGEGGSVAQALDLLDPSLAAAFISDNGPIYRPGVGPDFYGYATAHTASIRAALLAAHNRRLTAVLLTPGDPNDPEIINQDLTLIQSLGYTGFTYSAVGGYPTGIPATAANYVNVIKNLFADPRWTAPP